MKHNPFFLTLSRESQRDTLEALIFASDEPLTTRTLFKVLILEDGLHSEVDEGNQDNDEFKKTPADEMAEASAVAQELDDATSTAQVSTKKKGLPDMQALGVLVQELVQEINDELIATERPYRVVRIAGGLQFATTFEFGEVVSRLMKSRTRRRLSQAALEALAIIAYKQPISKPEIEAIRGINSNEVINSLVEKNLVTLAGRSDAPGKPLLYGTTEDFLRMFGLHSVKDLPKLRELDDLFQNKAAELANGLDISVKTTSGELLEKIQSLVDNEQKMEQHEREHADMVPESLESLLPETEMMSDTFDEDTSDSQSDSDVDTTLESESSALENDETDLSDTDSYTSFDDAQEDDEEIVAESDGVASFTSVLQSHEDEEEEEIDVDEEDLDDDELDDLDVEDADLDDESDEEEDELS